jgi:hypothetical protein
MSEAKIYVTPRGFRVYEGELRIRESMAVRDYEDAPDNPGSSCLWIDSREVSREGAKDVIALLSHWLKHKRLPEGPPVPSDMRCPACNRPNGGLLDRITPENLTAWLLANRWEVKRVWCDRGTLFGPTNDEIEVLVPRMGNRNSEFVLSMTVDSVANWESLKRDELCARILEHEVEKR